MFTEVLKNLVDKRVKICSFEGAMNGVVVEASDNAVIFCPDFTRTTVILNPMWIVSVKQLDEPPDAKVV